MGGTLVFNDDSRLFATWYSISDSGAAVYVSQSANLEGDFDQASFTTQLRLAAGNATGQQNLAVGPDGTVYLAWRAEAFPFEPPVSGIFVRSVSGEASGDIVQRGQTPRASAIDVELYDEASNRLRAHIAWTGSTVVLTALPAATYEVWLRIGEASVRVGAMPVQAWGRTAFAIGFEERSAEPEAPQIPGFASGLAAAILVLAVILASLQYTRIEREDLLQRNVRRLMFGYIQDHPGSSFSEVRDAMGLRNGVASYHLGVLENQGLLHSESRRKRRWFYANGDVSLWRDLPLSPLQQSLMAEVRRWPGIGVRELARAVNRRASSVSDNVKGLARDGILRTERVGRRVQCYPLEANTIR